MTSSPLRAIAITMAFVGSTAGAPAIAGDVSIDAPLATRIVQVDCADFTSRDCLSRLYREIRTAARDACKEQYPTDTYYLSRACSSGSVRDALDQLRELQARQSDRYVSVGFHLAISIRPK